MAPEAALRAVGFEPEAIFPEALRDRLGPLERAMDWLVAGPLVFQNRFRLADSVYLAGDALGFVDPFTGSGILAALLTGQSAGWAAARGLSAATHRADCRRVLGGQYRAAWLLRRLLASGLAESLAAFVPGEWLYRVTRPSLFAR
jgi:hypothetical protein